ncbi:MAG: AmmeMemoRadiSam system protein A [Candidatus Fermentibacteraceae bacterium]|nr:AmmeMemoRadiSam system protein A [Candidatus Fermentibacteraceae bacterium]
MTDYEKSVLLSLARRSVMAAASGEQPPDLPEDEVCRIAGGAFVTLKTDGRLRGCIGHFTGTGTLGSTVIAMAREAAVSDPRFIPVSPEEVDELTVEISVLSPMKRIQAEDVVPGKHGLYIRQGSRAGTLLPQVAQEEGWNRETFLSHTCMKAGLAPDAYTKSGTEIFAYTAEVFSENKKRKRG